MTMQIRRQPETIRFPDCVAEKPGSDSQPTDRRRPARLRAHRERLTVAPAAHPRLARMPHANVHVPPRQESVPKGPPDPRTDPGSPVLAPLVRILAPSRPIVGVPPPRKYFITTLDNAQSEPTINCSWSHRLTGLRRRVTWTSLTGEAGHLPGSFSRPRDSMPKRLRFFGVPRHLLFLDCVPDAFRVREVSDAHGT